MKRASLAAAAALMMALSGCQQGGSPDESESPGTIALQEEGSPFVSFNLWFKVGSQNDPSGKEGLAALTAALISDGSTTQDSYESILEKLYPMSAEYTSSVDKEMTVFRGLTHVDNLDAYYTLLKNAVLSPAFNESDFDRIKTQSMSYLKQVRRFSSDEELGKELLFREVFRGTPYEHPEEGYVQSVETITLEDVRSFYAAHYRRGSVVVGVAGGFPRGFPARLRSDFDSLPSGEAAAAPPIRPSPIDGLNVLIVEKPTKATAVSFGFPISLLRSDDDFYAMMLANSWLGEHRSAASHLYQVIRETRGMNYGNYSYIEAYPLGHTISMPPWNVSRRSQIFQIWIRPVSMLKPGDMHDRALFATRAALRELKALIQDGMSAEEFEERRGFLKNYTVNYGSTLDRRLGYAMDDAFYSIPAPGHLALIRSELDKLTLDDVNSAIRKHLQSENMWIIFITQDADALKAKLASGKETPILYAGTPEESVLEEDKLIQSLQLPVSQDKIQVLRVEEVLENGQH